MIWALLITPLAGLLNRFRGGGLFLIPGETTVPDHKYSQVRRITYATFMGLAAWNPFFGLALYLSLLTGWGFPVSAAIKQTNSFREPKCWPLDKLTELIVQGASAHVYGVVWLSLHGLFFGGLAALALWSFWPLLWGLMGVAYKVARDWERGEIYYGLLQGFTITLYLLTVQ